MWIYPFANGNGRVVRLFTGVCLKLARVAGYGQPFQGSTVFENIK
jgi:fido (protein-threonine AMPylation protein)